MFVVMDILLDWSMHNILWYLCVISAFFMQKDFISPEYLFKESAKGIQVVTWTVNTFNEKKLLCANLLLVPALSPRACWKTVHLSFKLSLPLPQPSNHIYRNCPLASCKDIKCANPIPGGPGGSHKQ